MDCEKFDTVTMELLYGELDELSEAAALRHLHHCNRCRDIWGHLRTTRELSEIPLEDPPAELFECVMQEEAQAKKTLPLRERTSRVISILAEYAMRPQLAMAALLLLMIGSSLVFVRTDPSDRGQVSVTELGTPNGESVLRSDRGQETLVFEGDRPAVHRGGVQPNDAARTDRLEAIMEEGSSRKASGSADQTYNDAMAAYQEGRYAEAERLFSEVASSGDERAASAALHEGHAARNGSGCQRAAALYDSVAARYAGGTVADEASWHAASCYRAMGQVKRASAHYTNLREKPAYAARASKALEEIEARLSVASTPPSVAKSPAETEAAGTQAASAESATKPKISEEPTSEQAEANAPAGAPPPTEKSEDPKLPAPRMPAE